MTDANYKQKLIDTFRKLSENYAGQWTPTASKTGFLLSLKEGAIYISTYLDGQGIKNIRLYKITNDGAVGDRIVVSLKDEPELYETLLQYHEQIRIQVKANSLKNIEELLES